MTTPSTLIASPRQSFPITGLKDVVILTTTFYPTINETRFHLCCQMLGNAIGCGYKVVIVDGSPNPLIPRVFERLGAEVYEQTSKGLGNSRRQLFGIASTSDYPENFNYLWMEPEKVDLVRFIDTITIPLKNQSSTVVIPTRSQKSLDSYPAPQVQSEQSANAIFAEILGGYYDIMFGPVAFSKPALHYFVNANPGLFGAPDTYIQQFAPIIAFRNQEKVVAGEAINFLYPLVQRMEEETVLREAMKQKRSAQLEQCTAIFKTAACIG